MLEQVGSGSMGVVWRARDERLERTVAVKQLLAQPGLTEEQRRDARRRAMREARIAARLHHPNAIVVFDVAEHDGDPCLVMEYMAGRSLAAVLTDRGSLPVAEVAALGSQVASALAAAHASGIVHRDIKPGNVLIDDAGVAKITDFGIAKAVGDVTVTQTGLFAGTPAYLAPEVARGQDPTTASDVFSFGATLYDAIEGGPPFPERQNQLALLRLVAEGAVQPPKQAGVLTSLLMKLLRPDAADRPTMAQASTLLAELAGSPAVLLAGSASKSTATKPDIVAPAVESAEPAPGSAQKPAPTAVAEPARPAEEASPTMVSPAARPVSKDLARKRTALFGAAALVVVIVVLGVLALTMNWFGGNQGTGQATGQHGGSPSPTTGQQAPPPTGNKTDPSTTPPTSSPPVSEPGQSQGVADISRSGVLVINFYNNPGPVADAADAWNMLSPHGQSYYGSEQQFQAYWSGFKQVYGNGAHGVSNTSDGSALVPVAVTGVSATGASTTNQKSIRVIVLNGQLLIDGDTRIDQSASQ